jgi:hypothetical protein
MGPGSAAHHHSARKTRVNALGAAQRPGHESEACRTAVPTSSLRAQRSTRVFPRRQPGLRRCARNDGVRGGIAILQQALQLADTPSRSRGVFRPSFASSLHPLVQEGAGKAGCRLAPTVRCANGVKETAQRHTGEAQHTAFPARWFDGLCRALPGAEFPLASLAFTKFADTAPVDANVSSARA